MKRRQLERTEPCEMPEKDGMAVKCQLLLIDEDVILNADIFEDRILKARYFADKEKKVYRGLIAGIWKKIMLKNLQNEVQGIPKDSYGFHDDVSWETPKEKSRAREFLGRNVCWWEREIEASAKDRAYKRKQERIDEEIAEIPLIEDLEEWVMEEFFQGEYSFAKKTEKKGIYETVNTCCGYTAIGKVGRDLELCTCPECGKEIRIRKRAKSDFKEKKITAIVPYKDKWAEMGYRAICTWNEYGKHLRMLLDIVAIGQRGRHIADKVYYGQLHNAEEYEQEFWTSNPRGKKFGKSRIYPRNMAEALKATGMERSGMDAMIEVEANFNKFFLYFVPYYEYLAKNGFTKLLGELTDGWCGAVNTKGKTQEELLKIDKQRANRLKQINGGATALYWLQHEQQSGKKIPTEHLIRADKEKLTPGDLADIMRRTMSPERTLNYIWKHGMKRKDLRIWDDYLDMAEVEGMDTTDDLIRFPRDLRRRHDELVETRNQKAKDAKIKKYATLDQWIKKRVQEAAIYYWKGDDYTVIPLATCKELMEEGRKQHHCVGASDRYMRKMANGESWICVLRKNSDIQTPYYTLEIDMRDDKILQKYAAYDRQPNLEEVNKVLEKFLRSVRKKRQQKGKGGELAIAI